MQAYLFAFEAKKMENTDDKKEAVKGAWWRPAVSVFAGTSAWIAGPIIIALILGKYLDAKFGTRPVFFFVLIGVAFLTTILGLWRMLRKNIWKQ